MHGVNVLLFTYEKPSCNALFLRSCISCAALWANRQYLAQLGVLL
jgi:hypothetical protein